MTWDVFIYGLGWALVTAAVFVGLADLILARAGAVAFLRRWGRWLVLALAAVLVVAYAATASADHYSCEGGSSAVNYLCSGDRLSSHQSCDGIDDDWTVPGCLGALADEPSGSVDDACDPFVSPDGAAFMYDWDGGTDDIYCGVHYGSADDASASSAQTVNIGAADADVTLAASASGDATVSASSLTIDIDIDLSDDLSVQIDLGDTEVNVDTTVDVSIDDGDLRIAARDLEDAADEFSDGVDTLSGAADGLSLAADEFTDGVDTLSGAADGLSLAADEFSAVVGDLEGAADDLAAAAASLAAGDGGGTSTLDGDGVSEYCTDNPDANFCLNVSLAFYDLDYDETEESDVIVTLGGQLDISTEGDVLATVSSSIYDLVSDEIISTTHSSIETHLSSTCTNFSIDYGQLWHGWADDDDYLLELDICGVLEPIEDFIRAICYLAYLIMAIRVVLSA